MSTVIDRKKEIRVAVGLETGRGKAEKVFGWPASEIRAGFRLPCPSPSRNPLSDNIDATDWTSEPLPPD